MTSSKFLPLAGALLVPAIFLCAEEPVDLAAIHRIKAEALENSKVMEQVFYLTDANGPRLTNSPGFKAAGDWVVKRLQEYGLTNVHEEPWGPFGRSWNYTRYSGHMIAPQYSPLIGFPMAWTEGTNGPVQAEAVYAPLEEDADFQKAKGKLKGKIVLIAKSKPVSMSTDPLAHRFTEAELNQTETIEPGRLPELFKAPGPQPSPEQRKRDELRNKIAQILKDEGALVAVRTGYNGDGGTIFAMAGGSREMKDPVPPRS